MLHIILRQLHSNCSACCNGFSSCYSLWFLKKFATPYLLLPKPMKTLRSFTSTCALAALLPLAQAQTPATAPAKHTKTADQRAATYQGPKVVKDTKALGRKMVQKSKATDMRMPVPVQVK